MVTIKCSTPDTVTLPLLTPFQGDLKKRTDEDIGALAKSIIEDGLLMPFAIWQNNGTNYLLDGHGRLAALNSIISVDPSVMTQEFPVVIIKADTEENARKALLQITSSYGHITKKGAVNFTKTIPTYHAPAINKFVHKVEHVKVEKPKTEALIKICVPLDKEKEVRELLKQVSYIKVV